jgi:hypothetical protein
LTVFAGFILAVLLHAAPLVWVEIEQNKPPFVAGAPAVIHSTPENSLKTTSRESPKAVVE